MNRTEKETNNTPNGIIPSSDDNSNKKENHVFRYLKMISTVTVILLLVTVALFKFASEIVKSEEIPYSTAIYKIKHEDISKITLIKSNQMVYIYLNDKSDDTSTEAEVYKTLVPDVQIFMEIIEEISGNKDYTFKVLSEDPYNRVINILKIIFCYIIILVILKSLSDILKKKIDGFDGKSITEYITGVKEENIKPVNTSNYSFDDVAGIDNERWEVEEVVLMLKNPEKYRETGAKVPKGILLNGKPGTGKTLIAKAIAGEAGVNFYTCAGSNFDNMFVGVGASKVRDLFEEARKNAPSIIFIDEIDAIAQKRYTDHSYNEQTLNQLLSEMDGFNETDNVILIAATNHYEALDPAITRAGRFDRIINIPLPNRKGRFEILKVHSRNKKFLNETEKELILEELAKKTSGMSGATLENILNEASIIAVRNNRNYINREDIDEAFIKVILGISGNDKETSESAKKLTAYHEAGHAIVARIKRPETKILQVSVIPRGTAGGYTLFEDKEEDNYLNKEDFYNNILVSLGGRAAEQYIFKTISIGASSDLEKANRTAHEMIYTYAMGNENQMIRLFKEDDYNEKLVHEMYSVMKELLDKAYKEACEVISNNSELLNALAYLLINNKSTLNADELEELFEKFGV